MNHIVCCSTVSHLLCSPHQEWNSLWWISTKRFENYKEWQFSQVCYLKPGNLGIQFIHRGSQGSSACLSGRRTSGLYIEIESLWGYLIIAWPHLKTGVIIAHIPLPFPHDPFLSAACIHVVGGCTVSMGQTPSIPWVTHLITAPSSLIPNSVGRACQTAYAERRGDFEMLLMTPGHKYPLSFTPPHSFFRVHSCHLHLRPFSILFTAILLMCWSENARGVGGGMGCSFKRRVIPIYFFSIL